MANIDDKDRGIGLYNKFHVERIDYRDLPGQKHEKCEYFVLDITHDPHALPALLTYAESCRETHPQLSKDLVFTVNKMKALENIPEWPDEPADRR